MSLKTFRKKPLPVPPEAVALLRIPIPLGSLSPIVTGLKGTYGEGLVIRTDLEIDGWLAIATEQARALVGCDGSHTFEPLGPHVADDYEIEIETGDEWCGRCGRYLDDPIHLDEDAVPAASGSAPEADRG